uniref:ATP synthase complex subunit 8 n=1 Tax=Pseudanthias dispar TaxID=1630944 RepID=A0A0N7AQW8_9TELE|nr:ATP synthase F0 subunit 8 [Pseudanthias dispar]AJW75394.1 ATP synthase F0 subunit 8 [Pseudanthias dispar]WNH20819.1 ATP synthase F0 subunit 8 [Pseudanthias bicolor]
MPQLDPTPWFSVLLLSWLVFLTVLPQKVTSHTYPKDASRHDAKMRGGTPWLWPWQ